MTPNNPTREPDDDAEREAVATSDAFTVTEQATIDLEDEDIELSPDKLTPAQQATLRELTRLHRSLAGPQTMLETAGHFNRAPFPAPHRRPR